MFNIGYSGSVEVILCGLPSILLKNVKICRDIWSRLHHEHTGEVEAKTARDFVKDFVKFENFQPGTTAELLTWMPAGERTSGDVEAVADAANGREFYTADNLPGVIYNAPFVRPQPMVRFSA